jgi:hypothetical protein
MEDFLQIVQTAASNRILFTPHAILQMSRPSRMITPKEIRRVIDSGFIIEDYPEDVRGHSCLMLGHGTTGRAVHVVCSPKLDYLAIITAYIPNREQWSEDFRIRR